MDPQVEPMAANTGIQGRESLAAKLATHVRYLATHLRPHTEERPFKCTTCSKGFVTRRGLQRHVKLHTGENEEECQLQRTPAQTLEECEDPLHIPSEEKQPNHCSPETGPQEKETHSTATPPQLLAAPKPRPFLCPQCPKTYCHQKHLDLHMKVHSPDNPHVCPFCNKAWVNDYQLTAHLRTHTGEKLFKCPADGCPKEFVRRYSLEIHMRVHTGENMEPRPGCAICGISFSHARLLKVHNWKFHNPQKKQHPCDTCGKIYLTLQELKRHVETHLPDDPQECPICGKSCRNGLALKEHVERHGKEGTFKCEHCLENFKTIQVLRVHIRNVHNGRKHKKSSNHVCSFCGRKCNSPAELAVHLRTHTGEKPFKCTACPKAFKSKEALRAHFKVHTGEKPEECQFCGQWFALRTSLRNHLRMHTGETPYKCDKCKRSFRHPSSLKWHRMAVHSRGQREGEGNTRPNTEVEGEGLPSILFKDKQGSEPLPEAMESSSHLYLELNLRQLSIPIPRMELKDAGGGVLKLKSGGECWYACSKCGRGSKSTLIRCHQSNTLVNEAGQNIQSI